MEHLPLSALTELVGFLTAADVARVTGTCRALGPAEPSVQAAIGLVLMHRYGDVIGGLRADDPTWPRSALTLRCAEALRIKRVLATAVFGPEDAVGHRRTYVISRGWTLAWKKRSGVFEQHLRQFLQPTSKRKKALAARSLSSSTAATVAFVDSEAAATREAATLIVCPHGQLRPAAHCVGRLRRVVVTRSGFRVLSALAPELRAFPVPTTTDCLDCITERVEAERADELRKQERFEGAIDGSTALVELLLRKTGFPSELFSPSASRGHTLLSLGGHRLVDPDDHHPEASRTYYLVPKKWISGWRQYVRSQHDAAPGPIRNAELVCDAHQRSVVPPYLTMFLSGFSLEVSLQATQALGACASTQYEIVTMGEWEALFDRYCAEYAVGFDIHGGSYHWRTPECTVCHYGMGGGLGRRERKNRGHNVASAAPAGSTTRHQVGL